MAHRFLLVQLADIGDMILTTPAIAALRAAHPDAHIALLAANHAVPVIDPALVDEIITFHRRGLNNSRSLLNPRQWWRIWQLRSGQYDTVMFFHHFTLRLGTWKFAAIAKATAAPRIVGLDNGKGWFLTHRVPDEGFGAKHQAAYWLELVSQVGAHTTQEAPETNETDDNTPRRAQVAFDRGVLPLAMHRGVRVIIHAGSGAYSHARRWEATKFAQVADALHTEFDAQVVLVGTEDDQSGEVKRHMQHTPVDLTGKTTLTQLADVIRSADLFIGTDSGIMHLAAAVRTPVVTIFGPSNHQAWGPWSPGGKTVILRSAPECSPCSYVGHSIGLRHGCAARTCMRMVKAEQVLDAARAILTGTPMPPSQPLILPEDAALRWTDTVTILDVPIARITFDQWMQLINRWVWQGTHAHHVCTTNPEFLVMAQRDPNFKHILQRADLCIPDGVGLLWAAKSVKQPLPERVTGSDGTLMIAEHAAKYNWKLFLLGAAPGVAERVQSILEKQYFGIMIVGTYAGSPAPEDEDDIVQRVNASGAHVLLVAYGAPNQDKWIARNLPRLNVKMAMGVGGALDFIAGVQTRAPQWMRDYGLEWLYRLYKDPRRIVRMMRLPRFVLAVLLRGGNSTGHISDDIR